MTRLVNLTPHDVVLFDGDAVVTIWPPAGSAARVRESVTPGPNLEVGGHLVLTALVTYDDEIEGLPNPTPGIAYVVSRITAARVPDRADVWFPFPEKRRDGALVGCTGLARMVAAPR